MALDVETLLVVNAANLLVSAATLPLIMGRELSKAATSARNSLLVKALGLVAIVVSGFWPGRWPDHVISAIAVGLFSWGQWLFFRALQGWLGPRPGQTLFKMLVVIAPLGYALASGSFVVRTAWANLMLILQLLIVCRATLWPLTSLGGRWRWVIFGSSLGMAAFTAAGTVLVVFYPDLYPSFMSPHPVNVATMLAANVTLVLATIATLVAWREEAEQQLREQALTDAVTGLTNRHGWNDGSQIVFEQARRHGTELALILIDLDHFKRVNDAQGHNSGDKVLTMVGEVLRSNRRAGDLAARIGGDEFALLLPQTDVEAAVSIEQRLRHAMHLARKSHPGLAVTYSAGIAMCRPGDETISSMMVRADAAMYLAKGKGRGQTEILD